MNCNCESSSVAVPSDAEIERETDVGVAAMHELLRERGRQICGVFVYEARVLLAVWCVLAVACAGVGVLLWYMGSIEERSPGQGVAVSSMVVLVSLLGYLWGSVGRSLATAHRAIKSLS